MIWGAAGGLGVFATQLCALTGADAVGVVSSDGEGRLIEIGSDRLHRAFAIRRDDAEGGETPEQETARFKESRRFG